MRQLGHRFGLSREIPPQQNSVLSKSFYLKALHGVRDPGCLCCSPHLLGQVATHHNCVPDRIRAGHPPACPTRRADVSLKRHL